MKILKNISCSFKQAVTFKYEFFFLRKEQYGNLINLAI